MAFSIRDRSHLDRVARNLSDASEDHADSLEKLSSGVVFSSRDPRPADKAIAQGFEWKLRSLASAKRNINDSVSVLQTAESSLSEIGNMILRMKEINVAASQTTLSDRDRKFLFVEYQALFDEVNRLAVTTEFNGIPLLNNDAEGAPEQLVFRLGDPLSGDGSFDVTDLDDINTVVMDNLQALTATTDALGLRSARELLEDAADGEGVALRDVLDLLESDDPDLFPTSFDQALDKIADSRSLLGSLQTRMNRAIDFVDVTQENITAAKSNITDTDFATETTRLVNSRVLMQAGTSLLTQGNLNMSLALNLLNNF